MSEPLSEMELKSLENWAHSQDTCTSAAAEIRDLRARLADAEREAGRMREALKQMQEPARCVLKHLPIEWSHNDPIEAWEAAERLAKLAIHAGGVS